MKRQGKIRVLIVDDSALMRQLLTRILEESDGFEVVGIAADPFIAREKIKQHNPDVLTLDIEMPGMDGITFLERLMRLRPMPVVMISSLTERGAQATLRALDLGAVDFVAKPRNLPLTRIDDLADEIRSKVRAAAMSRLRLEPPPAPALRPPEKRSGPRLHSSAVVAIGASAGGTQAIKQLLDALPADTPGIAIVQHMPPKFTTLFADRLNQSSAVEVHEARDGDRLSVGCALVAPGGLHMAVRRDALGYFVEVYDAPPVNRHRPSVDVLFESVAQAAGSRALGVILTGMGDDGARGLRTLRARGAMTVAQNQETCVVFGMPDQAIRLGGVQEVLPLDRIAPRIEHWAALGRAEPQARKH
ncbi:MAG TPA: chemotaxis response regulator protein-glutamate methylesterase [Acidiferrobacterales bacterium]